MGVFPKFIWCWLLIVLVFEVLNAQSATPQKAIIKHKEGSVFIGEILSKDSLQTVLLLSTGDTIHIPKRKIRNVEKHVIIYSGGKFHFTKGIFLGYSSGFGSTRDALSTSSQVEFLAGYRANEKVSFALGLSSSNHSIPIDNSILASATYLPIYVHCRYYPWKWRMRPYLFHQMGYGFGVDNPFSNDRTNGGLYFQPGVGIHFASRRNFRYVMSISQSIQRGNGSIQTFNFNNPVAVNYDLLFNRTMFKFGLEFR
jgi:hypothetical protein